MLDQFLSDLTSIKEQNTLFVIVLQYREFCMSDMKEVFRSDAICE